MHSQQIAI